MKKAQTLFSKSEAKPHPLVTNNIKSLTSAICQAAGSLSKELNGSSVQNTPYANECIQLIRGASNSVLLLIDDLAVLEKLQTNSSLINPVAVYNLRQELESACDNFAYEALSKQIDLSLYIPEDIPVAFCDIVSLRLHVLHNILSNAVQHTPVGGMIAVTVRKSASNTLTIIISDSCKGIPTAKRDSVFRSSRKSDQYRSTTGLYNALLCVQAHQGTLDIVDQPEFSGASFKIEIPLLLQLF